MTINELEQAVAKLSEKDLSQFRAWFDEYYAQVWDRQIERDVKSGRLDTLLSEVDREYATGSSKPL